MEVKSISLSRLLKVELPGFIATTILILKKHDVEKLHLDFWLKVLEKNNQQVKTLKVPLGGGHPLSAQVASWHNERLKFISSIITQMRGITKGDLPSLRYDVHIANEVVKTYLSDYKKLNKMSIESQINNFLNVIEKDANIKNVFLKLGLMPYIDALEVAHQNHGKYYAKRRTLKTKELKRDDNKAIKREGELALRSFFEHLDIANKTYPELNYAPLIRELNVLIAEHTNLINTRATYNKKRALKAKAIEEAIAAATVNKDVKLMTVNDVPTGVMVIKKNV